MRAEYHSAGRRTVARYGLEYRDLHLSFHSSLFFILSSPSIQCFLWCLLRSCAHADTLACALCSEVKGGSGGVGGEEKTSKMCVFTGPVSHYIGV